jgi:ABC-2 type transport system permease protein
MPARALAIKPPDFPSAVRHWWRAYENLLFIRWANIRNEWYFGVIVGMLFPIAIMIFMKFSGSTTDPATGLYVASGNAVMSLVMGPMQSLCNDMAWGRQRNDLDYFAALPVTKLQVTLAYATVSGIFIIPAMLFSIGIGSWWFGFPVKWNPVIIPVMLLASLSMAGLGVMAGVYARGIHQANMFNSAVMLVVVFLSPVLIPYENLPGFLQVASRLLPTSYAAAALRGSLSGMPMPEILRYLGLLLAFTAGFLYLGTKRLDWRID